MRRLLLSVSVLLAAFCIAESFSPISKPLNFQRNLLEKNNILKNKMFHNRAKRSLVHPLTGSAVQKKALFQKGKVQEQVREKRSLADRGGRMHFGDVTLGNPAIKAAMEKVKAVQRRAASFAGIRPDRR